MSATAANRGRLILFDRDGTLNVPVDRYVLRASQLTLLPGAAEAVAMANALGTVVVITNQQGVARGLMSLADLDEVHRALSDQLAVAGAHLDAIYVCPHLAGTCDCRKPLDGLFRQALAAYPQVSASNCVMIGDQPSDVIPAVGLGMKAILVGQRGGSGQLPDAVVVVDSVLDAMHLVVAQTDWTSQ